LHKGYTKHKEAKVALKPTKQLAGHTRLKAKNNNYKLERKKVIQQQRVQSILQAWMFRL
jgi:hypothetical protein